MNTLTERSLNTHGSFSEPSLNDHVGKGREGKGRGREQSSGEVFQHLQSPPAPEAVQQKHCRGCDETKPLTDFNRSSRNRSGRQSRCIACGVAFRRDNAEKLKEAATRRRAANADLFRERTRKWRAETPNWHRTGGLKKYGLTVADYEAIHARQSGLCAICEQPERAQVKSGALRSLAVDHDHATGAVRGLLCSACNMGLGHFGDNVELMGSAMAYLVAASEQATA